MSLFDFAPDYEATLDTEPSVRTTRFGDGYAQRVAFGINTIQETWSLSFSQRPLDEITDIKEFLEDKAGVDAFQWVPPGETDEKNFICQKWSRAIKRGNLYDMTMSFVRVYDPL